VARPFKAVIKYVNFTWHVQQMCSPTFSNWHRKMAHDVAPSIVGGFTAPALVPIPLLRSAPASTSFNCVWNSHGLNIGFYSFLD
jgi:hypothetical protein